MSDFGVDRTGKKPWRVLRDSPAPRSRPTPQPSTPSPDRCPHDRVTAECAYCWPNTVGRADSPSPERLDAVQAAYDRRNGPRADSPSPEGADLVDHPGNFDGYRGNRLVTDSDLRPSPEGAESPHLVWPEGPPCSPQCPGDWSEYHRGYSWGREEAEREATLPGPPLVTTRFTLAQALIGSELIDRLLDYSNTDDDPRQVAQSWAHRIADWIDHHEGRAPSEHPHEEPDVVAEVAAALTDRHIRADGHCSESHYTEAAHLVTFLAERRVTISAARLRGTGDV